MARPPKPEQLELPLAPRSASGRPVEGAPHLRVIRGGRQRRIELLSSREAVVRVLVEAGADLLLRRITPERAELIQDEVDEVLVLFDRVDAAPALMPQLTRRLDELEALMSDTRRLRSHRTTR